MQRRRWRVTVRERVVTSAHAPRQHDEGAPRAREGERRDASRSRGRCRAGGRPPAALPEPTGTPPSSVKGNAAQPPEDRSGDRATSSVVSGSSSHRRTTAQEGRPPDSPAATTTSTPLCGSHWSYAGGARPSATLDHRMHPPSRASCAEQHPQRESRRHRGDDAVRCTPSMLVLKTL